MKRVTKKLLYFVFMVIVISGMLLVIPGVVLNADPKPPAANIEVVKEDNNGDKVSGATIGLYDGDGGTQLDEVTIGASGKDTFKDLNVSTDYWVREISAPTGYTGDFSYHKVTTGVDKTTTSFTIVNVKDEDEVDFSTLTVHVQKTVYDGDLGSLEFKLYVDEGSGFTEEDSDTCDGLAGGKDIYLTWMGGGGDFYVVESGTGGAGTVNCGDNNSTPIDGTQTDTYNWDGNNDWTKNVFFKNYAKENGDGGPGESEHGTVTITKNIDVAQGTDTVFTFTVVCDSNPNGELFGAPATIEVTVPAGALTGNTAVEEWPNGHAYVITEDALAGWTLDSSSGESFKLTGKDTANPTFNNIGPASTGGGGGTTTIAVAAITEPVITEDNETAVIEVAALQELPRTGNNMLFYVIGFALMAIGVAFGSVFIPKALRKR